MYELTGYAGFSHVAGDAASIESIQARSAHYFQRPDADHVTFDPTRTSLSGYSASVRWDKNAGRRTLWGAQISARSPGFEINDLGRLSSADAIDYNADIQIRDTQPSKLFRSYRIGPHLSKIEELAPSFLLAIVSGVLVTFATSQRREVTPTAAEYEDTKTPSPHIGETS